MCPDIRPATELWSADPEWLDTSAISSDLVALRSGCGADPLSTPRDCPDGESLWARSQDGGLARRHGNTWRAVIGDTVFLGADGTPPRPEEMTAAAVSENREWLLVGTQSNGVGLYHTARHIWISLNAATLDALPAPEVTHIRWWKDRFWVGGPAGLGFLQPHATASQSGAIAKVTGRILDLDADARLWVLEERTCANTAQPCLRLSTLSSPSDTPRVLIDTRDTYPELNLAQLSFAYQRGNRLALAGASGLYTYDTARHTWNRLFEQPVLSTLRRSLGRGFDFGYAGGAARYQDGELQHWAIPDQRITKLLRGRASETVALADTGNIISLQPNSLTLPIYNHTATAYKPQDFVKAVALPDGVLFLGPKGALLHDVRARTYQDVPLDELPPWLQQPDIQHVSSGQHIYSLAPDDQVPNATRIVIGDANRYMEGSFYQQAQVAPHVIPLPVHRVRHWDDHGIGLMARDGNAYHIAPKISRQMTGPALEGRTLVFNDVLVLEDKLVVADDRGLHTYNMRTRAWSSTPEEMPDEGRFAQVERFRDKYFVRTAQQRLVAVDAGLQRHAIHIGSDRQLGMSDRDLSDVLLRRNQHLYLAGNRRVVRYDLNRRRVDESWLLRGVTGEIDLIDVVDIWVQQANQPSGPLPLALADGAAFVGHVPLEPAAGPVVSLSVDKSYIWTVRQDRRHRYLKGYSRFDPFNPRETRCFFRTPVMAGDNPRVGDAQVLESGLIAVTTNTGVQFYSQMARSWYAAPPDLGSLNGRLYRLGEYLAIVSDRQRGQRLQLVRMRDIQLPDSCAKTLDALPIASTYEARSVAVDEARGIAAWITAKGAVRLWENGAEPQVYLPELTDAPDVNTFWRVYSRGSRLLFTERSGIHVYDLGKHIWQFYPFAEPYGTVNDINLEAQEDGFTVTVSTQEGAFYAGSFNDEEDKDISAKLIATAPSKTFGARGDDILDVIGNGSTHASWTFVLPDRLKFFDSATRSWRDDLVFPYRDETRELRRGAGVEVVVSNAGKTWWVERRTRGQGTAAKAHFAPFDRPQAEHIGLDTNHNIWRLRNDGSLLKCTAAAGQDYTCAERYPAAMSIDPAAIQAAYQWKQLVLLVTSSGLRAYDQDQREERQLPAAVALTTDLVDVYAANESLWLLTTHGQLMRLSWTRGQQLSMSFRQSGVTRFVLRQGVPWAHVNGGWQVWNGVQFQRPRLFSDAQATAPSVSRLLARQPRRLPLLDAFSRPQTDFFLTIKPPKLVGEFLYRDQAPLGASEPNRFAHTAVDQQGRLYWRRHDNRQDQFRLPNAFNPLEITGLIREHNGQTWWVQRGHRLDRLTATECPFSPRADAADADANLYLNLAPGDICLQSQGAPVLIPAETLEELLETPLIVALFQPTLDTLRIELNDGSIYHIEPYQPSLIGRLMKTEQTHQIRRVPSTERVPVRSIALEDKWPSLRHWVMTNPDGKPVFNPIRTLESLPSGRLVVRSPSGETRLSSYGTTSPALRSSLDAGWIKWDRTQQAFQIRAPFGESPRFHVFAKQDFVQNGHLLCEEISAVLATGPKERYVANRFGIWRFPSAELGLNNATITFRPISLPGSIVAAHGQFALKHHTIGPRDASLTRSTTSSPIHMVEVGDVTLSEHMLDRSIDGSVDTDQGPLPAFGRNGFAWDDRFDIAFDRNGLQLLSGAGIHALDRYTGFNAGPLGQPSPRGRLHTASNGDLYFTADDSWYAQAGEKWAKLPQNPLSSRTLLDTAFWTWGLRKGQLHITLHGAQPTQVLRPGAAGLGFRFDHLSTATSHRNHLYIMTDAFFEIALTADQLADGTSRRLPPVPTNRLESLAIRPGETALYRRARRRVSRWDPNTEAFQAIGSAEDPYRRRLLAQTDRLRFTMYPQLRRIEKELRLDRPQQAQDHWVAFRLRRDGFPFDIITSIGVHQDTLYVGSEAGLQIYTREPRTRLQDIQLFYDLRPNLRGRLTAATRIGIPSSQPNRLLVKSRGHCLALQPDRTFAKCGPGQTLKRRWRGDHEFWHWWFEADLGIVGFYKDAKRGTTQVPTQMREGRFQHDRLQDVAACQGAAASLWQNGWVSVYAASSINPLAITSATRNTDLSKAGPQRFICLTADVMVSNRTVSAGLYLEGRQHLWRLTDQSWMPIHDQVVISEVRGRAHGGPIVDRKRLRLPRAERAEGFVFQQRTLAGRWIDLPWTEGRVAIDHIRNIVIVDDVLWAETPQGLVAYMRDARSGELQLDPDTAHIVREPEACDISDIGNFDGAVMVRCEGDSRRVFSGTLTRQQDMGVFQTFSPADPFAEEVMITHDATGYWEWLNTGRVGGSPGSLQLSFKGEPLGLTNGRFDFDTFTSMAVYTSDRVELATLTGGWFWSPRSDLHVRSLMRPSTSLVEPGEIYEIGVSRHDGANALCLRSYTSGSILLSETEMLGSIDQCAEDLGRDALWQYAHVDGRLSIRAPGRLGGRAERTIRGGRFTDDIATSLPITGRDEEGAFYIVPTQAGLLRLDSNLHVHDIYAPDFAGFKPGDIPKALYLDRANQLIYLSGTHWHVLDEGAQVVAPSHLGALDPQHIVSIDDGPQELIRLHWRTADARRGWLLLSPDTLRPMPANTLPINTASWRKFIARRADWKNPSPWFTVEVANDYLRLSNQHGQQSHLVRFPPLSDILTLAVFRNRALLVGRQELWEVNLSLAMSKAFQLTRTSAPAPAPIPTPSPREPDATITRTLRINFPRGLSQPSEQELQQLDQYASEFKRYGKIIKIVVTGHTDNTGEPLANQALSVERAEMIADILVANGLARNLIEVRGQGANVPIAVNDTPEGRAENRRVEIVVIARVRS